MAKQRGITHRVQYRNRVAEASIGRCRASVFDDKRERRLEEARTSDMEEDMAGGDTVIAHQILAKLKSLIQRYPNLRLGQLIANVTDGITLDLYYLEDVRFYEALKAYEEELRER